MRVKWIPSVSGGGRTSVAPSEPLHRESSEEITIERLELQARSVACSTSGINPERDRPAFADLPTPAEAGASRRRERLPAVQGFGRRGYAQAGTGFLRRPHRSTRL